MKGNLKQLFSNGTLHRIFFWIGLIALLGFLLISILIPSLLNMLLIPRGIYIDVDLYSLTGACCLVVALFSLLLSYFLPSKKRRRPHSAVPEGSDQYLDQEAGTFSPEEREAILQESWMAVAERFNRNRRV